MSIKLADYKFQGPYTSTAELKDRPGIYAIHCNYKNQYTLIDIGESAQVKSRVDNHERMKCWLKNCQGIITVSVYYTKHWTQEGRFQFQQKLRKLYNPPCGKKSDSVLNFIND
ncbi:MAG: hypothetical protein ACOCVB_02315 [Bacillota bacterium]